MAVYTQVSGSVLNSVRATLYAPNQVPPKLKWYSNHQDDMPELQVAISGRYIHAGISSWERPGGPATT